MICSQQDLCKALHPCNSCLASSVVVQLWAEGIHQDNDV